LCGPGVPDWPGTPPHAARIPQSETACGLTLARGWEDFGDVPLTQIVAGIY
jgi:hypothetical protein